MLNVLIFSAEPRLVDAVKSNFADRVAVHVDHDPLQTREFLLQTPTRLAFFEYELIRNAPADVLIHIDSALQHEQAIGVLLCRTATTEAVAFRDRFNSLRLAIDLSRGREQFDEKVQRAFAAVYQADDASISTDRLMRHEIDLPVPDQGTLGEFPLGRLLYTIWQRRESGALKLRYATHELTFAFHNGELSTGIDFNEPSELLGAFAWSHGHYNFVPSSEIAGWKSSTATLPILPVIAEGCRSHSRQRAITETMTPIMRRYPVQTNLWAERAHELADDAILSEVISSLDGSTTWETALSALGQRVTEGFRAAYFALQTDLVHTVEQPGLIGVAVLYSRSVRRAREAVEQAEVEQTKAYKATSTGRSEVERELGVQLAKMRRMTPYEIFDVWEGCGRKVVRDRFYVLVKEHHPDVYGGNTTGNVRTLAQDIFIRIKDAYQELLSTEDAQLVAPKVEESAPRQHTNPRQRLDTPRLSGPASEASEASEAVDEPIDVRARLSQMSSVIKRKRHRARVTSLHGPSSVAEETAGHERTETPISTPSSEPELSEAEQRELDRKAKLDYLLKRAQEAGHPDANPAREAWDRGFHAYKEGRNKEALEHFTRAFELDPEDAAYKTFYAYLKFLNDPSSAKEVEGMLRAALQAGNRQVAPDACLFLAHTIKAQGREEEALTFYRRTLRLNPASRDAEREVRLAEMRNPRKGSDPGSRLKNLFKK